MGMRYTLSHGSVRTTPMEFMPGPDLVVADEFVAPSGNDLRPKHLSPSSSGMYQQCPRKWRHRYVDRLPDPPGVPALVGTFAHLVLEHLLQLPAGSRSKPAAKNLARALWPEIETEPDYKALALDVDQARAFRWRAWQAIEGLWALEDPNETEVHATEQEVQVTIGSVPFRGIIDRLDRRNGELVVSDYKSGKAPSDRFRDKPLKQVLYYAAAVHASTGERPLGAQLLYLGQRSLKIRVTDERLQAANDDLDATWAQLTSDCERNEFRATTSALCAWCPFIAHCDEGQAEVITRNDAGRVRADAPALAVMFATTA